MGLSVIALDFRATVARVSYFLYNFTPSIFSNKYDILLSFFFLLTLIISPYQVHMGLQNIEMGAGSGQLPLVCLHHPDINMQL